MIISFQELCLQYGENKLTRTMLIDFIKQREKYLQLCIECKENEISLLNEKAELKQQQYDIHYQKLQSDYDYLYKKWEEFSKCLNMKPEKFISMLDKLKESIKSNGNEIAQLREQLKTSELDAKRYKNDGIQDRVKLQEVTEELEKVKKLMNTPCKEVKELIDNLKQMNDDKMDTISKLETTLIAVNKDKEMMLSYYAKELESIIKMRDNWKADCEDAQKCFQAERDKRWELEEEVKHLREKLNEQNTVGKKLCKFDSSYLTYSTPDLAGYISIFLTDKDNKIWHVDTIKDSDLNKANLHLYETETTFNIYDLNNSSDLIYIIDKNSEIVDKKIYLICDHKNLKKLITCQETCFQPMTNIYLKIGLKYIRIDTVFSDLSVSDYICSEDSTKTRYCIVRRDSKRKDLRNYAINKETLEIKVID